MTPQRWQRIEQIYYAALERAPAARVSFLVEACADDESLLPEVEALLSSNEAAGSFMNAPAMEVEAKATARTPMVEPLGEQLSHYRILEKIGAGGMGEVYLALDEKLERKVAIKLLPPQFSHDHTRLQRFVREAKAASALNHPNIITIYEIGESAAGEPPFIVTEFIEGATLRAQLAKERLPLREALALTLQAASALAAAHRAGIIHRDIKPENIMVRPDGLVKVLDFGLARMTEAPADSSGESSTEAGTVMGTPRYMSPEQARGLKVDARTDIFSLGVVLYEMVAGQVPFVGASTAEVFVALLGQDPPPLEALSGLPADLQEELETIIWLALEKDRTTRYQTISEFAADLERLKHQLEQVEQEVELAQTLTAASGAVVNPSNARRSSGARRATLRPAAGVTAALTVEVPPPAVARWRWWALALVLLGGVGFAFYQWISPRISLNGARHLAGPSKTIPFTSFPGVKEYCSFSNDGNAIVFAWDGAQKELNGKRDIYVKQIGVGDPQQLTHTPEDELIPAWSPDGVFIAFLRDLGGKYGVYLVPARGGAERKLTEASSGLSWSPDSKWLALASLASATNDRNDRNDQGSILLLNLETGEQRRLMKDLPPVRELSPAISPDGKTVAFLRSFSNSAREIFVVPLEGGAPKQLTTDKRPIFGLAWTADSNELVFSANRGGGRGLWRVSVKGGVPERIVVTGQNPSFPAISRQGNRLAYTDAYTDSNLYLYEGAGFAGRGVPGKFGEPRAILTSTREDTSPQFSPDGTRLVFTSQRNGSEEVFGADSQGEQTRQLTAFDGPNAGTPHWSPDGKWIAFDSRANGSPDIYVISAEGGAARRLTTELNFDSQPSWSHDGKWIFFTSDRSGRYEIWKLPVEGGPALQITKGGAFEGFESPDGKLFYFSKNRGVYGLWSVPVEGGEEKPVPELKQAGYWRSWGVIEQGIYFISKETTPRPSVRFFSFATRQVTSLLTVEKDALWWEAGLALSPDGRKLIYAQLDHSFNDIFLMENFR